MYVYVCVEYFPYRRDDCLIHSWSTVLVVVWRRSIARQVRASDEPKPKPKRHDATTSEAKAKVKGRQGTTRDDKGERL